MKGLILLLTVGFFSISMLSRTVFTEFDPCIPDSVTIKGLAVINEQNIRYAQEKLKLHHVVDHLRDTVYVPSSKMDTDSGIESQIIPMCKKEYIPVVDYKTIVKTIWVGHAYSPSNNTRIDTICREFNHN